MDHAFLPRSIWTGDSKFLQHPADLYTSVVVTRSIPAGTCFGPCLLQNTFYDTIAFIAQKSCDKAAKSYVFRVSCAVWWLVIDLYISKTSMKTLGLGQKPEACCFH